MQGLRVVDGDAAYAEGPPCHRLVRGLVLDLITLTIRAQAIRREVN